MSKTIDVKRDRKRNGQDQLIQGGNQALNRTLSLGKTIDATRNSNSPELEELEVFYSKDQMSEIQKKYPKTN